MCVFPFRELHTEVVGWGEADGFGKANIRPSGAIVSTASVGIANGPPAIVLHHTPIRAGIIHGRNCFLHARVWCFWRSYLTRGSGKLGKVNWLAKWRDKERVEIEMIISRS